uniref:Uncharacterized protein LOC102810158 n=1 Tax=Saccoglossus kowalevskii TaxID=10224 RepID=A0ABM0M2V2_SACKO|nr:PREDICTED: uncharacterized protein LOC102810158 [Saccoglossus kowalevskii]
MSRLKKDGTPDMRYSCNRSAYLPPGRNVGGGYDMRSSVNRQLFNEPRQMTGGPTRMDGKPDMRYKVNKEAAKTKVVYSPPVASMKVTVPHVGPIRRDGHPDMRYSENRAHLPSNPLTKGPTNVDGTLDMRYTVTKKAVDAKVILPPQAEKVTPTGPTSKKGQPDMRYHENRAHLPSGPLTKGPTNVDGTLDMRYTVNKKAVDAKARRALYPKLDIEDDFYERAKEDAIPVMRIPLREDYQDEYEDDYDSDDKRIGIEQKTVCNKLACAEIDEVKLHVNIERDNYEPIESGWRVTQVNVGDNVMVTWSDYSPKFPSLERHILQGVTVK